MLVRDSLGDSAASKDFYFYTNATNYGTVPDQSDLGGKVWGMAGSRCLGQYTAHALAGVALPHRQPGLDVAQLAGPAASRCSHACALRPPPLQVTGPGNGSGSDSDWCKAVCPNVYNVKCAAAKGCTMQLAKVGPGPRAPASAAGGAAGRG